MIIIAETYAITNTECQDIYEFARNGRNEDQNLHGFNNGIRRNDLLDPMKQILSDGTLTVRCEVILPSFLLII